MVGQELCQTHSRETVVMMSEAQYDALKAVAEQARQQCRQIVVDEYTDALKNGLDHATAYRCVLAAFTASAPKENQ